jgi:hypothetical protein
MHVWCGWSGGLPVKKLGEPLTSIWMITSIRRSLLKVGSWKVQGVGRARRVVEGSTGRFWLEGVW